MVDPFEFGLRIVEQQGIVALVLLIMMLQNSKERAALLHKNCELSRFIMDCLKMKLAEDSPMPNATEGYTRPSNFNDLASSGIIIPGDTKIEP